MDKEMIPSEPFNTILLCVLFSSLIATFLEKRLNPLRNGNSREDIWALLSKWLKDPFAGGKGTDPQS